MMMKGKEKGVKKKWLRNMMVDCLRFEGQIWLENLSFLKKKKKQQKKKKKRREKKG